MYFSTRGKSIIENIDPLFRGCFFVFHFHCCCFIALHSMHTIESIAFNSCYRFNSMEGIRQTRYPISTSHTPFLHESVSLFCVIETLFVILLNVHSLHWPILSTMSAVCGESILKPHIQTTFSQLLPITNESKLFRFVFFPHIFLAQIDRK